MTNGFDRFLRQFWGCHPELTKFRNKVEANDGAQRWFPRVWYWNSRTIIHGRFEIIIRRLTRLKLPVVRSNFFHCCHFSPRAWGGCSQDKNKSCNTPVWDRRPSSSLLQLGAVFKACGGWQWAGPGPGESRNISRDKGQRGAAWLGKLVLCSISFMSNNHNLCWVQITAAEVHVGQETVPWPER